MDERLEQLLARRTSRLERAIDVGPDRRVHEIWVAPGEVRLGVFGVRAGRRFSFAAVLAPDMEPLVSERSAVDVGDDLDVTLRIQPDGDRGR